MSAVFRCDICRIIDTQLSIDTELCPNCDKMVTDIRAKSFDEAMQVLGDKFGIIASNQMKVIGLMAWLRDEKSEVFRLHYGTEGEFLLNAAIEGIEEAPVTLN